MQKKEIDLMQLTSNERKGMNKILSQSMVIQLLASKYHTAMRIEVWSPEKFAVCRAWAKSPPANQDTLL